jgi:hydrogenase maturation protease
MKTNGPKDGDSRVVVIGVGNDYRHDDAVGLFVARQVEDQAPRSITVYESDGEAAALMDAWKGADLAILCDAVCSGADPGTIYLFDVCGQPIPRSLFSHSYSTHDFNVSEAIELARALGELPERLVVYGIEGEDFGEGQGMSPLVEQAAEHVTGAILLCVKAAVAWSKGVSGARILAGCGSDT